MVSPRCFRRDSFRASTAGQFSCLYRNGGDQLLTLDELRTEVEAEVADLPPQIWRDGKFDFNDYLIASVILGTGDRHRHQHGQHHDSRRQLSGRVAVSPDGSHAYVVGDDNIGGALSVINTDTNTVSTTIGFAGYPTQVAVSPDGSHVYVTKHYIDGHNSGAVAVINTDTNTVSTTIPVGDLPSAIAVSPDGSYVYVTNTGSGTVSLVNTVTNTVTTIPVGNSPGSVAVSPDGRHAYVTNIDGTVSVISL
jgi:YVTN family beta-propeller protein